MAEGQDMSAERPLPESAVNTAQSIKTGGMLNGAQVPEIEIQQPQAYKLTMERRLELENSGQYEQISKSSPNRSWSPPSERSKTPIKYLKSGPVNVEHLVAWAERPVTLEDGKNVGTALENIGVNNFVPDKNVFRRNLRRLFDELVNIKKKDIGAAHETTHDFAQRFKKADKPTQSNLMREVDDRIAEINKPPKIRAVVEKFD